ncbi:MAG: O-antigen translocase [Flavobacteriaceae bacterium]|nr:O-antigen translocase [Flavobacteriaceae bacterium]
MNFLKTSLYSSISTIVNLIVRLITNKIVAVYLSTDGMFLLGQLKDFMRIANVTSNFGTLNGTLKYSAEYKENLEELKSLLGTSFKIHLFFSLCVFGFILLFKESISYYLFQDNKYSTFLVVLGLSVISVSFHALFLSILNGFRQIKIYVIINVISTIIGGIVIVYLTINYKTIGAFYAFAINQVLTFLVALILILVLKPFRLNLLFGAFKISYFKKLSQFSIMALVGPLCAISATLFVRDFLSSEFDKNHAGSWEGMWRISAMYLLFLTTTMRFYILPTFSTLSGGALRKEVFKIWKHTFPIILVITLVVYLSKDLIIPFFLSKDFLMISSLMAFHLLGDTIKINGWVLGNILISKAKTKAFIFFQIEWAAVFSILTYFLVHRYGFVGVSMAYFYSYVIHFTLLNLYFKNLLWTPKHLT